MRPTSRTTGAITFGEHKYRSTSRIDKLLKIVLGAIADSQRRFYVQRFLYGVGLGFGDSTLMRNTSDSYEMPILIVSAEMLAWCLQQQY
jgi:hypothetical protein